MTASMTSDRATLLGTAATMPTTATVLVIAYRMRDTIAASIASAFAQTVPCEIIVSDDCSGDGTLKAARKLSMVSSTMPSSGGKSAISERRTAIDAPSTESNLPRRRNQR